MLLIATRSVIHACRPTGRVVYSVLCRAYNFGLPNLPATGRVGPLAESVVGETSFDCPKSLLNLLAGWACTVHESARRRYTTYAVKHNWTLFAAGARHVTVEACVNYVGIHLPLSQRPYWTPLNADERITVLQRQTEVVGLDKAGLGSGASSGKSTSGEVPNAQLLRGPSVKTLRNRGAPVMMACITST